MPKNDTVTTECAVALWQDQKPLMAKGSDGIAVGLNNVAKTIEERPNTTNAYLSDYAKEIALRNREREAKNATTTVAKNEVFEPKVKGHAIKIPTGAVMA